VILAFIQKRIGEENKFLTGPVFIGEYIFEKMLAHHIVYHCKFCRVNIQ
jgi:hypothetical protein